MPPRQGVPINKNSGTFGFNFESLALPPMLQDLLLWLTVAAVVGGISYALRRWLGTTMRRDGRAGSGENKRPRR
jgi:hypothetical protein